MNWDSDINKKALKRLEEISENRKKSRIILDKLWEELKLKEPETASQIEQMIEESKAKSDVNK